MSFVEAVGNKFPQILTQTNCCKYADELRMAVREVICENDKERRQYEEALVAITVEESLKQ